MNINQLGMLPPNEAAGEGHSFGRSVGVRKGRLSPLMGCPELSQYFAVSLARARASLNLVLFAAQRRESNGQVLPNGENWFVVLPFDCDANEKRTTTEGQD